MIDSNVMCCDKENYLLREKRKILDTDKNYVTVGDYECTNCRNKETIVLYDEEK